jgi:preprotein translocase subunit SecD
VYAPQQQLTQAQLENVAQVLRQRAAGMGLKGAQVTLVPQGIQVAAWGARAADFALLGQTGTLAFRPVLAEATAAKAGSGIVTGQVEGTDPVALQTAFARLNCVPPSPSDALAVEQAADTASIVACGANQNGGAYTKYALGPVAVAGTHVASAKANMNTQSGGWEVDLTFDAVGTGEFANVTARLAANQTPTNQFAIVLSGMVQSSPYVAGAITGGQAVISGSFDKVAATGLAAQLSYGSIPPLVLKETVIPG